MLTEEKILTKYFMTAGMRSEHHRIGQDRTARDGKGTRKQWGEDRTKRGTGDTRAETGNISRRDTTKRRQHNGGSKEDRGDRRQDDRRSATGGRRRETIEAGDPTQVTEHTH